MSIGFELKDDKIYNLFTLHELDLHKNGGFAKSDSAIFRY